MRKITELAVNAFYGHGYFKRDNTQIDIEPMPHGVYRYTMKLYNTIIATRYNGVLTLNTDGWYSNTTKERLNGVLAHIGAKIFQKNFQWYVLLRDGNVIEFKDGMEFKL